MPFTATMRPARRAVAAARSAASSSSGGDSPDWNVIRGPHTAHATGSALVSSNAIRTPLWR